MAVGNAAYENVIRPIPGLVADGDLNVKATHQYKFVYLSGEFKVALAADNSLAIGVLCNLPKDGKAATVAGVGSSVKLQCGTTITYGQKLCPKSDASGEAVVATTGDSVCAIALGGGSDHDYIPAYICGGATISG